MYQNLFFNPSFAQFTSPAEEELPEWDLTHLAPEYAGCNTPQAVGAVFSQLMREVRQHSGEMTKLVQKMNKEAKQGFAPHPNEIGYVFGSQQQIILQVQRSMRAIYLFAQEHFKDADWQGLFTQAQDFMDTHGHELNEPLQSFEMPPVIADYLISHVPQMSQIRNVLTGEAMRQSGEQPDPERMKREYERAVAKEPRLQKTRELFSRVHNDPALKEDAAEHTKVMTDLINAKYYQSAVQADKKGKRPDELASERNGLPADFLDKLIPKLGTVTDMEAYNKISDEARRGLPKPKTPPEFGRKIPWEEARELVIESFRDFHPDMGAAAELAFEKNWIHARDNGEKFFNPFTSPPTQSLEIWPGNYPYVLTHYEGDMDDLRTLAHEMGHAVAMHLGSEKNMEMAESIALHESFAHFAEKLVLGRLHEQETSIQAKASIKCDSFNRSRLIISGQGQNSIEHALHKAVAENIDTPLTTEQIAELTRAEMKKVVPNPSDMDHVDAHSLLAPTAHSNQMMQSTDYYNIAYPIAEATSLTMAKLYNGLGTDQRKQMADTWIDIMRAGPDMNYGSAMQAMGISITTPEKLVSDASDKLKEDYATYCRGWPLRGATTIGEGKNGFANRVSGERAEDEQKRAGGASR